MLPKITLGYPREIIPFIDNYATCYMYDGMLVSRYNYSPQLVHPTCITAEFKVVTLIYINMQPCWWFLMLGGSAVVEWLALGLRARGPGFHSRPRHLNFQRLVISCFQFEIWLKDRWINVNPQNNQPTNLMLGMSVSQGRGIVLEPPITPVPPRGNFRGYDFLKAYEKCYKMSHVCTLAVGAFRIFGEKREKLCKKITENRK